MTTLIILLELAMPGAQTVLVTLNAVGSGHVAGDRALVFSPVLTAIVTRRPFGLGPTAIADPGRRACVTYAPSPSGLSTLHAVTSARCGDDVTSDGVGHLTLIRGRDVNFYWRLRQYTARASTKTRAATLGLGDVEALIKRILEP